MNNAILLAILSILANVVIRVLEKIHVRRVIEDNSLLPESVRRFGLTLDGAAVPKKKGNQASYYFVRFGEQQENEEKAAQTDG